LKAEVFRSLKQGLPIGKNGELVTWGTKLRELKSYGKVYYEEPNSLPYVLFETKEFFPNTILGLYTPFDTLKSNDHKDYLFHVGQNLNESSVRSLIKELTMLWGKPDQESDYYGIYRRWEDEDVFIEIIPRSHYGSDWNAIIIGKKNGL
jgi:hypothetical protein